MNTGLDPSLIVSVPAILGLTNAIKRTGLVPDRWSFVVSLILGVLVVAGMTYLPQDVASVVGGGLLLGLGASGLYDMTPGDGMGAGLIGSEGAKHALLGSKSIEP